MRKKRFATLLGGLLGVLLLVNTAWAGVDPPVLKTLDGRLKQINKDSVPPIYTGRGHKS